MLTNIKFKVLKSGVFIAKVVGSILLVIVLLIGSMPCLSFLDSVILFLKGNTVLIVLWSLVGVTYLFMWWFIPIMIVLNKVKRIWVILIGCLIWFVQLGLLQLVPFKAIPETFKHFFG